MRLAVLVIVLTVLAACGGGGDAERMLRFGDRIISEAEFRIQMQEADFSDPEVAILCAVLRGSTASEVAELIMDMPTSEDIAWLQEASPDDRVLGLSIIKEECARAD